MTLVAFSTYRITSYNVCYTKLLRVRSILAELDLRRLFNQLVLAAGGDVEEAMEWMRQLQERGYLGDIDLEAFFQLLEEEQTVARDPRGTLRLTAGGERQIRKGAFEEIS